MKKLLLVFFLGTMATFAQPPAMEAGVGGFSSIEVDIPATPNEKLIELTKNWALEANRRGSYDISNVTANSLTITAFKDDAFHYRNKGEVFAHRVKYDMKLTFAESNYKLSFEIKEIYANGVLVKYTVPDYFTPDGKVKENYTDLEESLEATVNKIVQSHYNYILNFR